VTAPRRNPDISEDLLDSSHWRPVHQLLRRVDGEIARVYSDAGIEGVKTRFAGPLIELTRRESMTIKQLADARKVTHSAMSQTVAAMRRAGLVEDLEDNDDARTRRVKLSAQGRDVAPFVVAEWRATEATLLELDSELSYSLVQVVGDIEAALARRSFRERFGGHFDDPFAEDA
jgi:DNA-binding MarR family transcriptional regulator